MKKLIPLIFLCLLTPATSYGWDSVGHRTTTTIALNFLSQGKREKLVAILRQHPRYQVDFLDSMPAIIGRGDDAAQAVWLLGQAAYWPDIARGLEGSDRQRYNRPAWHFTDGAWIRGMANVQGNIYLDVRRFPDITGSDAATIRNQNQIDNIITALDYNTKILVDDTSLPADRAVALCWVLHLMSDLHQPLHAGSLYSKNLFDFGDRGGNGITTDSRSLHYRWDSALAGETINRNVEIILEEISTLNLPVIQGQPSNWAIWLQESRVILLDWVYTDAMKIEIRRAENENTSFEAVPLSAGYVDSMIQSSRQRIGLAGYRIAIWVENELN